MSPKPPSPGPGDTGVTCPGSDPSATTRPDPSAEPLAFRVVRRIDEIGRDAWSALIAEATPFLEYEWLEALEATGAVGPGTGWLPRHLIAERGGQLVGAVAAYEKTDSHGEFIFDWGWAESWQRAGLQYYPKLVAAVPFTPVAGQRFLRAGSEDPDRLVGALGEELRRQTDSGGFSGVHALFLREKEAKVLAGLGYGSRLSYQFHWENLGYSGFGDYLGNLRSKKRKQILGERRKVQEQGLRIEVVTGDEITTEHVEAMWEFYASTIARKWSQAYLNRDFFFRLAEVWSHRLLLVVAGDAGRIVGGTWNVFKGDRLYGRYWGCSGEYPGLHFEACFYSLIEFAIERGLRVVEAGAQGEHKFLRGFAARPTWSSHYLVHSGGRAAVEDFLRRERSEQEHVIHRYNRVSPLKPVRAAALEAEQARTRGTFTEES